MPYCDKCGTEVSKNATVCHQCGSVLTDAPKNTPAAGQAQPVHPACCPAAQPPVQPAPFIYQNRPARKVNVGLLIWSIANIVIDVTSFFMTFIPISIALSISTLIIVCTAPGKPDDKSYDSTNKAALILNAITSVLLVLKILLALAGFFLASIF